MTFLILKKPENEHKAPPKMLQMQAIEETLRNLKSSGKIWLLRVLSEKNISIFPVGDPNLIRVYHKNKLFASYTKKYIKY